MIFRKLHKQKRASYKKTINEEPVGAINKKWLFGFPEALFAKSDGDILSDVRKRIIDLDKVAPSELGKGYRNPEGLWGCLLGKNDVLNEDGQGLTDIGIIKALRASNILGAYPF